MLPSWHSSRTPSGDLTCRLPPSDITRYSRQLLVPSFGARGQECLRTLRVLIVGAGGLGCPAALYLAGAGVGSLTVVDDDVVERSNLHRQVAHTEASAGTPKAESLVRALRALNSDITAAAQVARFSASNGVTLAAAAHVVLDASDNPATRYLVNDACVLAGVPLVSGAALGTDGQVGVYGLRGGPCYRCVHAQPPPSGSVRSCADAGVLGPVAGIVGALMALEVLKIAPLLGEGLAQRGEAGAPVAGAPVAGAPVAGAPVAGALEPGEAGTEDTLLRASLSGRLLALDGADARFRTVSLRRRSPTCAVCGEAPSIRSLRDSDEWAAGEGLPRSEGGAGVARAEPAPSCSATARAPSAPPSEEVPCVSATSLSAARCGGSPCAILDVRAASQFAISALLGSVSCPLADLQRESHLRGEAGLDALLLRVGLSEAHVASGQPVYVMCRRGVDSVTATRLLRARGLAAFNVTGGLTAWAAAVDASFPLY